MYKREREILDYLNSKKGSGATVREIAEAIHWSQKTVRKWLQGHALTNAVAIFPGYDWDSKRDVQVFVSRLFVNKDGKRINTLSKVS